MRPKKRSVDWYLVQIRKLYPDFRDDGLSWFPDWLYRVVLRHNITPAGRVHDWYYCTRCHRRGAMTPARRRFADRELRRHARELLPWYIRLAPLVLLLGTRLGGWPSFDSCGYDAGERCRHNIRRPPWMARG